MEMPEGWKDSIKVLEDRGFAADGVPHDSDLEMIREGLLLMREMAEALEEASYRMKPADETEIDAVGNALKKFKEWK